MSARVGETPWGGCQGWGGCRMWSREGAAGEGFFGRDELLRLQMGHGAVRPCPERWAQVEAAQCLCLCPGAAGLSSVCP